MTLTWRAALLCLAGGVAALLLVMALKEVNLLDCAMRAQASDGRGQIAREAFAGPGEHRALAARTR